MSDGQVSEVAATVIDNETGQSVIVEIPAAIDSDGTEAVAIAQIEAERDVTIAAIHADTEAAQIDASIERDRLWHEEQLTNLQEQNRTLAAELEALKLAQSTPLVLEPLAPIAVEPEPEAPTIAPTSLSGTQTEALSETGTEALEESEVERVAEPEALNPVRVRAVRMI